MSKAYLHTKRMKVVLRIYNNCQNLIINIAPQDLSSLTSPNMVAKFDTYVCMYVCMYNNAILLRQHPNLTKTT